MGIIANAVFFFRDEKVFKEMMLSEFEALLDGVVEMPDLKKQRVFAAFLQIDAQLMIRGLVFFSLDFTKEGHIVPEWNLPIQQLIQSAGRGPDLGGGAIKLACKSYSSVPWHQQNLWDPSVATYKHLQQVVKRNRLGIVESDSQFPELDNWDDIPTLSPGVVPPTLMPSHQEPPVLTPHFHDIPVVAPIIPVAAPIPVAPVEIAVVTSTESDKVDAAIYLTLKQEFDAMRAAYAVRIDRLQNERDEYKEKTKSIEGQIKAQDKAGEDKLKLTFTQELSNKDQQISLLQSQIEIEKKRYGELNDQLAQQAQRYQVELEAFLEKVKNEADSEKIESLKETFKKELESRVQTEISKVNEALAMREVELFYRDEQLLLFHNEIKQLKAEKQTILKESGRQILKALEDNGVTLVAYNVGVGHITLPLDDVGQYLDERLVYLAERCGVIPELFSLWQEHYYKPVCHHVDDKGDVCNVPIKRTDVASQFIKGSSDRCSEHQLNI